MIEENKIKKIDEEKELEFLLNEFKKIEDMIKHANFAFDQTKEIESILKLWEIRGKIKVEIDELIKKMTRKPGTVRVR